MAMNNNKSDVKVENDGIGIQNNLQSASMLFAKLTQETSENNEASATFSERPEMSNESQNRPLLTERTEDFCDKVDAVNVQSADVQLCEQIRGKKGYYPIMDFKRKGCALILSNDFEGHEKPLSGYNIDKENMRNLWKDLGCNPVDVKSNKNAEEIKNIILKFSDKIEDSNPSFIVVVIMSHGGKKKNKQVFYGNDSKPVEVDFVLDSFNNENAQLLQNIPKLFIFQFCRGVNKDPGITAASHNPGTSGASDISQPTDILPVYSDQFAAYPTHDNYISWVETTGSWFINAITNIFMTYAKNEHVADLFTMVNDAVKNKTVKLRPRSAEANSTIAVRQHGLFGVFMESFYHISRSIGQRIGIIGPDQKNPICKQMSVSVSSLTKKLYLYPGYYPESSN